MRSLLSLALAALLISPASAAPVMQPAIPLAPAIAESAPGPAALGVFFAAETQVRLTVANVRLAGSPDGTGTLCTDDEARIVLRAADGVEQVWSHRFASADGQVIECLPPQTLALAAGPGAYTVNVALIDRQPPRLSSRPYYLVPVGASEGSSSQMVTPESPLALSPMLSATATPKATITPTVAAGPPQGNAAASGAPEATTGPAVGIPPAAPDVAVVVQPSRPGIVPALLILLVLLAVGGAALLVGRRRRRPIASLAGIVDLADRESGEVRTLLLHRYPGGLSISRGPLSIAPCAANERPAGSLGAILPTPRGPALHTADRAEPVPLLDGELLLLARVVELRYRRR